MKNKLWLPLLVSVALLSSCTTAFAQTVGPELTTTSGGDSSTTQTISIENPINVSSIEDFVKQILDIVLIIGVPIVAFFIILSGFKFVAARGNPEALGEAKRMFLYTIIGAAILLGCWVIASAIGGTIDALRKP